MKKFFMGIVSLFVSFAAAFVIIEKIALPTLDHYVRLSRMIERFYYTDEVLILFLGLTIWLFILQWQARKISVVYMYLVFSVYLFLLFVVLFTKAATYHTFTFALFDFIRWDAKTLMEAGLNIIYFLPLGILYRLHASKKQFVVIALLTILGIETIQYVFYLGTFALSDILLNFCGCWFGYFLGRYGLRHFQIKS